MQIVVEAILCVHVLLAGHFHYPAAFYDFIWCAIKNEKKSLTKNYFFKIKTKQKILK